jgi:hypothetical protein
VFLVDGVLVENTIALWVGKQASFKSFALLDLLLCIATGTPWHGRAVVQGPVVYVSAEGSAGITQRIQAWEIAHGVRAGPDFYVLPEPVQLLDTGEVDAFLSALVGLPAMPRAIGVDTLARSMVGGDENSAKDMGLAVAALDRIRRLSGATMIPVHHVTKADGTVRGSSALMGAIDTSVEVTRIDHIVRLACGKQKDFDDFATITLTAREVDIDDERSSVVLEMSRTTTAGTAKSRQLVLDVLAYQFADGATDGEWRAACREKGVSRATFYRARAEVLALGLAVSTAGLTPTRWRAAVSVSEPSHGSLTGQNETSDTSLSLTPVSRQSHETGSHISLTSHPPLRGETVRLRLDASKTCPECGKPLSPAGDCGPCGYRRCSDCGGPTGSLIRSVCLDCGRRPAPP